MGFVAEMILGMLGLSPMPTDIQNIADNGIVVRFNDGGVAYTQLRTAILNFAWFYNCVKRSDVFEMELLLNDIHYEGKVLGVQMILNRDCVKFYPVKEDIVIPFVGRVSTLYKG